MSIILTKRVLNEKMIDISTGVVSINDPCYVLQEPNDIVVVPGFYNVENETKKYYANESCDDKDVYSCVSSLLIYHNGVKPHELKYEKAFNVLIDSGTIMAGESNYVKNQTSQWSQFEEKLYEMTQKRVQNEDFVPLGKYLIKNKYLTQAIYSSFLLSKLDMFGNKIENLTDDEMEVIHNNIVEYLAPVSSKLDNKVHQSQLFNYCDFNKNVTIENVREIGSDIPENLFNFIKIKAVQSSKLAFDYLILKNVMNSEMIWERCVEILDNKVLSSSTGFGDGEYSVMVSKNSEGLVVSIQIDFA